MVNHAFDDENAAPPEKQMLVSGPTWSPAPEAREIEELWRVMDSHTKCIFPEIWPPAEHSHRSATGSEG